MTPRPNTELEGETWRATPRSSDYMVSSLGRVMRISAGQATRVGRILTPDLARGGYQRVSLRIDRKLHTAPVHQLVCEAFHGPRPSAEHDAAHNNGVRTDNRESNLAWKTKVENAADREAHGTMIFGEQCNLSKFSEITVLAVRAAPGTHRDIGRCFGMSKSNVSYIKSRRRWRHI